MNVRRMASSAGLCLVLSRMNRSITSTADGLCARIGRRRLQRLEQARRTGWPAPPSPSAAGPALTFASSDDAERAFGADHQLRQIERRVAVDEAVEVVAADAAKNLGIAPVDLVGAGAREPAHFAVAGRLERVAAADRVELGRVERRESERPSRPRARRAAR